MKKILPDKKHAFFAKKLRCALPTKNSTSLFLKIFLLNTKLMQKSYSPKYFREWIQARSSKKDYSCWLRVIDRRLYLGTRGANINTTTYNASLLQKFEEMVGSLLWSFKVLWQTNTIAFLLASSAGKLPSWVFGGSSLRVRCISCYHDIFND